ncbi:hypothetical protein KUCAC02_002221, partial [Chaenocephalus aceratus]
INIAEPIAATLILSSFSCYLCIPSLPKDIHSSTSPTALLSRMIMDSPGRHAERQQGETMAVGTDGGKGGKREREGEEEQGEGGVAVLLNFN